MYVLLEKQLQGSFTVQPFFEQAHVYTTPNAGFAARPNFISHFSASHISFHEVNDDSSLMAGHCCSFQELMYVLMKEQLQTAFTI
jgi:hypothetical protein